MPLSLFSVFQYTRTVFYLQGAFAVPASVRRWNLRAGICSLESARQKAKGPALGQWAAPWLSILNIISEVF
jgi:hypothetical protein